MSNEEKGLNVKTEGEVGNPAEGFPMSVLQEGGEISTTAEPRSTLEVGVRVCNSFWKLLEDGKWDNEEHENPIPVYKTWMAAGADLFSTRSVTLLPGEIADIPVGIALNIPAGYECEIRGRSGLWFNNRVMGFNGTVDADYVGEIQVSLVNMGSSAFTLKPGSRIGQAVFKEVERAEFILSEEDFEPKGDRTGGMGSTGE